MLIQINQQHSWFQHSWFLKPNVVGLLNMSKSLLAMHFDNFITSEKQFHHFWILNFDNFLTSEKFHHNWKLQNSITKTVYIDPFC